MTIEPPPKHDQEFPVPAVWQSTFEAIVSAFVRGDFQPKDVPGLDPVSDEKAQQIRDYIADYADVVTLTDLTDETWTTSVAVWYDPIWRTLVDLRTEEEGASDLCLETDVREDGDGFRFKLGLVYVP